MEQFSIMIKKQGNKLPERGTLNYNRSSAVEVCKMYTREEAHNNKGALYIGIVKFKGKIIFRYSLKVEEF